MSKEVVLTNARIVTPDELFHGTVRVTDGIITGIDEEKSTGVPSIDLEGDYLLPGLIELHTDNLEKHFVPRPGVRWPSMAAMLSHDASIIAAGITTVFDAVAVGDTVEKCTRLRDLQEMVDAIQAAQEKKMLRADHFLHLRCEIGYPQVLDLFESFVHDPLVRFASLMDHTPGQRQFTRIEKLYQYYQGKYGFTQTEMERLVQQRLENQGRFARKHRVALLEICRRLWLPVASHDDTTAEHVIEAASEGIVVSEFPTTIEAARTARRLGLNVLAGGPNLVLGGSHSGKVSALELARLHLVDIFSSDYVPASLIQSVFLIHHELETPLPEAVAKITIRPAQIANLADRGAILLGNRADLIRVRLDHSIPVIRTVWRSGQVVF
jgi:alpha-D-ribose 1-methylphosphonate 5-triphosphate diphosphatase